MKFSTVEHNKQYRSYLCGEKMLYILTVKLFQLKEMYFTISTDVV